MVPALRQQPGTVVTTWMRGSDMAEPTGCSAPECDKPARARGLCWAHYKRLQRSTGVGRPTTADRLLALIVPTPSGCWEWTGELSHGGYGRLHVDGRKQTVHRLVYELSIGPVRDGLELDHLCRNRACCNPFHLEPVTPAENWRRGQAPSALNVAKTHCLKGHPLRDASWNDGRRYCPTCAAERTRLWRARGTSDEPP